MAFTPRDELERLVESTSVTPLRPRSSRPKVRAEELSATITRLRPCDSCGRQITEPGRFRHADCPPPPLPAVVADIRAQLARRRDREAR